MFDWDAQRGRLNHDVLKNQVMPSVSRLIRVVEGSVAGDGLLRDCCDHLLGCWGEFREGLKALLASADREGQDAVFARRPLCHLEEDDLDWMRTLVATSCRRNIEPAITNSLNGLADLDREIVQIAEESAALDVLAGRQSISQEERQREALLGRLSMVRNKMSELSSQLSALSAPDILKSLLCAARTNGGSGS